MDVGSIVVINLQEPREKMLGRLLSISPPGITIRGIEVNSFRDWMNQFLHQQAGLSIRATTVFFPMHRVVSCYLDEDMGQVLSFSSQFYERTKHELTDALEGG